MYYLNNFFIYSIFGYILETIMFKLLSMPNKSGFMHLWWTPFYGIGVIISIKLSNYFKHNKIVLFILLFISLSILEYIGGFILSILFKKSLWNYSSIPLHIGKYISIPTSFCWTAMSFIYIFIIKKYSDKLIKKVSPPITIITTIIFIIDFITTLVELLRFK
jgi:uncharacterized membrane protein